MRRRKKERKEALIVTMSGDALIRFNHLADEMNTNPETVLKVALNLLELSVEHIKHHGEVTLQNGDEESDLVLIYTNRQGEIVSMPIHDQDDNDIKPRNTLLLSENYKRILRDIGIEPD